MVRSPSRRTTSLGAPNPKNSKIIRFRRPTTMDAVASRSNSSMAGRNNGPKRKRTGSPGWHFMTISHPDQLKDKELMTENRHHVMKDYLSKQKKKVDSEAASASESEHRSETSNSRKRTRRADKPCSNRRRSCISIKSSSTAHLAVPSTHIDGNNSASTDGSSVVENVIPLDNYKQPPIPSFSTDISDVDLFALNTFDSPLVQPPSSFRYRRTSVSDVPDIVQNPGSTINPFRTLPFLEEVNTVKLKHSCSEYFGSRGLTEWWLPTLLTARHAFLSTICISAAHDDIMRRSQQAPEDRTPFEHTDRFHVNSQVVSVINDALRDPHTQIADTTIVAVLQILSSEIMGCNDHTMAVHQKGLHDMVKQRGGLGSLGLDGHLAPVIVINMYMISALRETIPHRDYVKWAAERKSKPPNNNDPRKVPESPVYCRPNGFQNTKNSLASEDPTHELLETLRVLTINFVQATEEALIPPRNPTNEMLPHDQTPLGGIDTLYDKLISLTPLATHPYFCHDQNLFSAHTYEALRLVGLIYAQALRSSTPFSIAAQTLNNILSLQTPIHILIQKHLALSNISYCWGDLAGILFFTALVASASANPYITLANTTAKTTDPAVSANPHAISEAHLPSTDTDPQSESELSRKWLAAVTVRCSIVLGFEHGPAILETLRRLITIEQALASNHKKNQRRRRGTVVCGESLEEEEDGVTVPGTGVSLWDEEGGEEIGEDGRRKRTYGPQEQSFLLRRGNFMDFAEDFRGGMS